MNKRILFISETVTMAHLIRPLAIASQLKIEGVEIHFAATRVPEFLKEDLSKYQFHQILDGVSEASFLTAIANGQHPYTEEILTTYVQRDLELLKNINPDLVIGDMRLSLGISCKLFGVPFINLSNSTWDPSAELDTVVPDIPVVRVFGAAISEKVYPMIKGKIMKSLAAPFNKVAESFGLKAFGSYYDVLTAGDYTIYNDLKSLVKLREPSDKKLTVGALIYSISTQSVGTALLPKKTLPRVLVTMGSSGPAQHLQNIVDSLSQLPIELIVATGGVSITNPKPESVHLYSFLPFEQVLASIDLLVFNGGSGTGYAALAQGVPFLAIPTNVDQHQYSNAVVNKGACEILRSEKYSGSKILKLAEKMLSTEKYSQAAKVIQKEIHSENPHQEIQDLILKVLKPNLEMDSKIKQVVADALKSPSGDNCQPWLFQWNGETLQVFHDETRGAHSLNRAHHASLLALGGLLESIDISASQFGLKSNVRLILKSQAGQSLWAEIRFTNEKIQRDLLLGAIDQRCTDRRQFKGGSMTGPIFSQIEDMSHAAAHSRVHLQDQISSSLMRYFLKSEDYLWENKKTVRDLIQWMRLTKEEVEKSSDGMSWKNMGVNIIDSLFLRLLRQYPASFKLLWFLGLRGKVKSVTKRNLKSSAGLICISVNSMDPIAICEAGRLAFRTWTHLNANGYAVQPLSFASTSVADLISNTLPSEISQEERFHFSKGYSEINEAFNLEDNEIPIWIFRTGLNSPVPQESRTTRREVGDVLMITDNSAKRTEVELDGILKTRITRIQNVSMDGICLVSGQALQSLNNFEILTVVIDKNKMIQLKVEKVWETKLFDEKGNTRFKSGFRVLEGNKDWESFVNSLAIHQQPSMNL